MKMEDLRAKHVGKRVKITGRDHPSRNMAGEVVSFDFVSMGLMMGVRLDDGREVGVFKDEFRVLEGADR